MSTIKTCIFFVLLLLKYQAFVSQSSEIYILEGDSSYKQGKYSEAISSYNRALAIEPRNLKAVLSRAWCYYSTENYVAAEKDFTQFIKSKKPLSLKIYSYFGRGFCYLKLENFKAAIRDFSFYVERYSDDESVLNGRAYAYYSLGDYANAIRDYNELLARKNQDSADHHFGRSLCYYKIDSFSYALKDIEKAISLNPNDFSFHQHKWDLDFDLKRFEDLKDDAKNMKRIDSSFAFFDELEGISFFKQEKYHESIESLSRQILKTPDKLRSYWYRQNAYFEIKEYEKAVVDLNKYIELNPTSEAYNERGWTYLYLENYQLALADLNESILLDKDNTDAYDSRGCAKYFMGDYPGAINDFNSAIRRNPEYANSYFHRGLCWIRLHKPDKACSDLSVALMFKAYVVFKGEKTCEQLIAENCPK